MALLPDTNEYAIAAWGGSNSNPQGLLSEALPAAQHLLPGTNGVDLMIEDITGVTVTLADTTPEAGIQVGMELRLVFPIYGSALCPFRAGKGTVVDVFFGVAPQLTMLWDIVNDAVPVAATGPFNFNASSQVIYPGHLYQNGDRVEFFGAPLPVGVVAGVKYFVIGSSPIAFFQLAHTIAGPPITWVAPVIAGAGIIPRVGGYLHWPDGRGLALDNVRVLTPYLPEGGGAYPVGAPVVPGKTFPASITSYEDAALFLPFTFNEGVDGYGVSNAGGTVTYGASTITDTGISLRVNILKGALVIAQGQIRTVLSNTGTVLTLTAPWTSTPSAGTRYEAAVPHWRDNPHGRTLGEGFRYPSNCMQPGFRTPDGSLPEVYNRPRGRLTPSFVQANTPSTGEQSSPVTQKFRLGHVVETAFRTSERLGYRVNVVLLGIDDSSLARSALVGGATSLHHPVGWWTSTVFRDWLTGVTNSCAARLRRMLVTQAPAALLADANSKPLKILGEVAFQGEADIPFGSADYGQRLALIHDWIRLQIFAAGLSFYRSVQAMPVVHAGLNAAAQAADTATGGHVQRAIHDWTVIDPSAATFDTTTSEANGMLFTGLGELHNGGLASDVLALLVVEAHAASTEDATDLEISNMALALLGERSKVFSFDPAIDASAEARLCAQFFPVARDEVMESHSWAFATKFAPLIEVTKDPDRLDWQHAYALPDRMANALEVLPPGATTNGPPGTELVPHWRQPLMPDGLSTEGAYNFAVEKNRVGQTVLYTNVTNAVLRYNVYIDNTLATPAKFRLAVARKLAALLAGPVMKGMTGAEVATKLEQIALFEKGAAAAIDSNRQQSIQQKQSYPWSR